MKYIIRGILWGAFAMFLSLKISYAQKLASESFSLSSFAIDSAGNLYAWGNNQDGQLGIGYTNIDTQPLPVRVPFPDGVTKWIAVASGDSHTLAIGNDGNLYAWGQNTWGQLGIGNTENQSSPAKVPLPSGVTGWIAVTAGYAFSTAIGNDGNLYAWGYNIYGRLGIGNWVDQHVPAKITLPAGVTGWKAVDSGVNHTLAIDSSGNLYTWGVNNSGELGIGSNQDEAIPVKVPLPSDYIRGWRHVAAGDQFSLAIADNGALYAWGQNAWGQLGFPPTSNGFTTNEYNPMRVSPPSGVTGWTKVTAGSGFGLAIDSSGSLYAWGRNVRGQLGIQNRTDQDRPVEVPLPDSVTGWSDVTGGDFHTLAIASDGDLYAWGYNEMGQLGIGNTIYSTDSVAHVLYVDGTTNLSLPIDASSQTMPETYSLNQNYPNPFNPSTRITYQLKSTLDVRLAVYDITGRQVAVLVNKIQNAGKHTAIFSGGNLSSGVYFYRLKAGNFVSVKKMLLLK